MPLDPGYIPATWVAIGSARLAFDEDDRLVAVREQGATHAPRFPPIILNGSGSEFDRAVVQAAASVFDAGSLELPQVVIAT